MEIQLGTSIKILCTDCSGEYPTNAFQSFCSSSGILNQFTCSHTSEQNGIIERKHRYIVDLALTLISQMSLTLIY